ncbi:hypothetical protein GCM10011584_16460 [Nocardioides phosphati]|uniref:Uncharacterized protein n=1 Tax=Nocardioides phosphati TaxID=1867775 RepID=A0ABQ2NA07_9ACTN|nr:hypothetical protein [Nocardioides phosphati]GGO88737.1 hypothetical protein GCM10011584_16460 [Nocardioides phosphati]
MTTSPKPVPATPTIRPMVLIGLGLLIDLVDPALNGWDLLPDWAGWILVLIGTAVFARQLPSRGLMLTAAAGALVLSAALWPPASIDWLKDQDASVAWSCTLPAIAWAILYSLALSGLSRKDPGASFWWKYIAAMNAAAAVLPILVYGGGMASLETFMFVLGWLGQLCATVFSFLHSRRDWALVPQPA